MGEDVAAQEFTREDRQRYREKVKRCLDVFARMLAESRFDAERRSIGLEIELNLTDDDRRPGDGQRRGRSRRSPTPTSRPSSPSSTSRSTSRRGCSSQAIASRARGGRPARASTTPRSRRATVGAHMVMIGILPTLREEHLTARRLLAPTRATSCSTSRSSPPAGRTCTSPSTASSGCRPTPTRSRPRRPARACSCTSRSTRTRSRATGTRRRRSPASSSRSARTRRSSSAASCGARRASRCSSRRPTRARRSSRPRACARACGSASAGSPRSSTCSRRTSATSRRCCRWSRTRTRSRCSSAATCRSSPSCACTTARSTAGTGRSTTSCAGARTCGWRTACCRPARRSSTSLANAAFYYGLVRVLAEDERPVWSQMSFSAAEENFHAGARDGIDARVYWPGVGEVPATELVLRRLLPLAHEGLERWGVDAADRDRLLGDHRAPLRRPSATARAWQAATFHRLYERPRPRRRAARDDRPLPRAHARERPVHEWPLP